ncbi:alpha/beta fold hydrolase [Streptomyces tailanensis]|uniref:alpha/beta fold hydrolase n=1 Tax=Streptomyces tailanensis TaxID=2569858 RepID=UPI00122E8583|nr:alpha/beta hydrolase [Streptomyces tailanensis]
MTNTVLTENATSRFVQTKKWRLHLNEAGEGHPLVLLHGGGPGASGWSNYSRNFAFFAERYRVLAVDMPGWGKSDTAVPGDRDHTEALELLLDELEIDQAALVGNSMGGQTAIRYAVRNSDRVSHLIPMGAPAPGVNVLSPASHQTEGIRTLIHAYQDPTPANFQALVAALTSDPELAADEDLARQRSEAALSRPDHIANYLTAAPTGELNGPPGAYPAVVPALATLTVPTLVVHGRDDKAVHFENALRLLAMIPDSRLYLFNRCGHWTQMEHAEEFDRVVHEFISATGQR